MKIQMASQRMCARLVCCGFAAWAAPGGAAASPRLLAQYQSVLHFHPAESFGPTSIQSFVADSELEQQVGARGRRRSRSRAG